MRPVIAAVVLFATLSLNAALILTPTDEIVVSDLTTTGTLGTPNIGSLTGGPYVVRSRANQTGEQALRIATFLQFDVSALTPGYVNSPEFKATFSLDYFQRLNNINGLQIHVGRNAGGSWDSSGSNNPLHDWGWINESSSIGAEDEQLLFGVLATAPPVSGISVDVSGIVADWVNGVHPNQGLVLFGIQNAFQGVSLGNAQLTAVPEPGTWALLGILVLTGIAGLKRYRQPTA